MQAADPGDGRSPLDATLDVFRMRQYFDVLVRGRELATTLVRDAGFRPAEEPDLPVPTASG